MRQNTGRSSYFIHTALAHTVCTTTKRRVKALLVRLLIDILVATSLALTVTKSAMQAYGLINLVTAGALLRDAIQAQAPYIYDVSGWAEPPRALRTLRTHLRRIVDRRLLRVVFVGPTVVTVGSAAVLIGSAVGAMPSLVLASGIAVAMSAVLFLITALARRLVLGVWDGYTSDVQLPGWCSGWGAAREGSNLAVYFLILAYIASLGYAALDAALAMCVANSFDADIHVTTITWVYSVWSRLRRSVTVTFIPTARQLK
jgi:hypothetical protein